MNYKPNWKKVVTREYSLLWASYTINAYQIMKKTVGTTLRHNLFHGKGGLLTIYRHEKDVQRSYDMIETLAKNNPAQISKQMDRYDSLVIDYYQLVNKTKREKNKPTVKGNLILLDKIFSQLVCHYLFFAFLGYAADQPAISKFISKNKKRFERIRMLTIDGDMHKDLPLLLGKINPQFKARALYMTRREFISAVKTGQVDLKKIKERTEQYLLKMDGKTVREYSLSQINKVLKKELADNLKAINKNSLTGQSAFKGLVKGPVCLVFTNSDYRKIKSKDILVTPMTKPDIVSFLKKVRGIVTNDGGVLCHASIISREMKIPCVVGTTYATDIFKDGDMVEVDANKGVVRKI